MDRSIKEDLYKKSCASSRSSSDSTLYQAGVKNELKSLCRRDSGFPLCSCSHRLGVRLCRSASLCREPSWSVPGSSCGDAGLNGRYDLQVHAMAALEREVAKDRERQAICVDYSLAVRFPQGHDGEAARPSRDTASQGTAKSADVLDGRAVRGDHQGVRLAQGRRSRQGSQGGAAGSLGHRLSHRRYHVGEAVGLFQSPTLAAALRDQDEDRAYSLPLGRDRAGDSFSTTNNHELVCMGPQDPGVERTSDCHPQVPGFPSYSQGQVSQGASYEVHGGLSNARGSRGFHARWPFDGHVEALPRHEEVGCRGHHSYLASAAGWPISFLCFCDWLVERFILDQHKPECPLCGAPPEAGQRYCDSCYKELGLGE